jgi:predicted DNA-binding protein with PD1-like motif
MDNNKVYVFRLKPGEDLRRSIEAMVKEKNIEAGWISTCVGSLTDYVIRFAHQQEGVSGSGHFEIVSLTGTVSVSGSHLHIGISDFTVKQLAVIYWKGVKFILQQKLLSAQLRLMNSKERKMELVNGKNCR